MFNKSQGIDKNILKRIFKEYWGAFKERSSRYRQKRYDSVVKKMLGCGDPKNGYSTYRCSWCGQAKKVPFSCKSCFCLSCAKVYVDNWVAHISEILFEGAYYRHVILTVPEELRIYFYKEEELLSDLMKVGLECLHGVLRVVFRREVRAGYIVVLQTAGRSGGYNPHLHILMTSGGIVKTPDGKEKWVDLRYLPYEVLHKKWQYYLFKMLKEKLGTDDVERVIDNLYKKYPKGLVAHIKRGQVPRDSRNLAIYLAKYVVSPPISIRRIKGYNQQEVTYWYKDHLTGKRKEETVSVFTFIGRMVQHILPKGMQRIRYYGLHSSSIYQKMKGKLKALLVGTGRMIQGAFRVVKKDYRQRIMEIINKDPFICPKCGDEMILWEVWHPERGVIFSEEKRMKRGLYETHNDEVRKRYSRFRQDPILQLSLPGL